MVKFLQPLNTSNFFNSPCPHLPNISEKLAITHTRAHRAANCQKYFYACHELAQSLWCEGSPAQAILQLDKAMMASAEGILLDYPYEAILWIIEHTPEGQFLGNPVRHFQHLASRMSMKQPNAKVRVWRAWACLYLTEITIENATQLFPRDLRQIEKEDLTIPDFDHVLEQLMQLGSADEAATVRSLAHLV